jgi:hypothetical protein
LTTYLVAFCDRNCNVIAPFVAAPGNRNESPLLKQALPQLTGIAQVVGLELKGVNSGKYGVLQAFGERKN